MQTKDIISIGIFASILCIFSVITIPISSIPITLSLFAVFFISIILGLKKSLFTVIIYILCGCLGLPVFSGFQGGFNVLLGPTGGYIIGYLFIAVLVGFVSAKIKNFSSLKRIFVLFMISFVSMFFCYAFGTVQFSIVTNSGIKESLYLCVYPFIVFDVVKIITSILIAETVKKHIKHIDI